MTDIDGCVEMNSRFLFLEWKNETHNGMIPTGQRIMFERLSRKDGVSVVALRGDPEIMSINEMQVFHNGRMLPWEKIDLGGVKDKMVKWAGGFRG